MFSCYFLRARIIRQSIQVLCPVFSRKVFFRGVEDSNKVRALKTSLSVSRQDFVEHDGQVISAAKQSEKLHVPLVATYDLLSESPNSVFGTSFFLRETINSLRETNKLAFTGNMNPLLKGTKLAFSRFGQHKFSLENQTCLFRQHKIRPGKQTCLFRQHELPYGNRYGPSGNNWF